MPPKPKIAVGARVSLKSSKSSDKYGTVVKASARREWLITWDKETTRRRRRGEEEEETRRGGGGGDEEETRRGGGGGDEEEPPEAKNGSREGEKGASHRR